MFLPILASILLQLAPVTAIASAEPSAAPSAVASVASTGDAGAALDAALIVVGKPTVVPSVSAAASVPAALAEPVSVDDALGKAQLVVDLYKAGKWSALAILIINLLMFGFKKLASPEVKRKWGSVVATGLGGVVASLSLVLTGTTWLEAALIFAVGPASSVLYDFLKAVKPSKA